MKMRSISRTSECSQNNQAGETSWRWFTSLQRSKVFLQFSTADVEKTLWASTNGRLDGEEPVENFSGGGNMRIRIQAGSLGQQLLPCLPLPCLPLLCLPLLCLPLLCLLGQISRKNKHHRAGWLFVWLFVWLVVRWEIYLYWRSQQTFSSVSGL